VSAGTFLPAGDLAVNDVHASVPLEAGRVLAGPSDINDQPPGAGTPRQAVQYDVSTWVASDVTVRWQATQLLTLEGQLKLTNPIVPFIPNVVGGAVGARLRLRHAPPGGGFAVEIGGRIVGVGAEQRIDRQSGGNFQTDVWNYRSVGIEAPLIVTYRVNPLFALTVSPFLRAYWIRAWHDKALGVLDSSNRPVLTNTTQAILQWSPVLSGGFGLAGAFDVGAVQLSPGMAVELVTKPGPNAATHFIFEPGLSVGTRF
jgi:hypothetical protein